MNGNTACDHHHGSPRKMLMKSFQRRFACTRWAIVVMLNILAIAITTSYVMSATGHGNEHLDGAVRQEQSLQTANGGDDEILTPAVDGLSLTTKSEKQQSVDAEQTQKRSIKTLKSHLR